MLHGLMAGSTGCCRVLLQHLVVGRPGHGIREHGTGTKEPGPEALVSVSACWTRVRC